MWYAIWQYIINPENAGVIQAFSAAASACFAFTIIWTTICQIRIYHKARIDGIKRDRAAIFVKSFNCVPGHKLGGTPKTKAMFWDIVPEWENTGHTETVGMMNYINIIWLDGDIIPPEFDFPDWADITPIQMERLFLGPKQTMFGSTVRVQVDKLDASKRGEGHYYIYGWTEYRDVFDRSVIHRTEFCRQVLALGMPSDPNCQFRFIVSGEFNGAEKDCYRKVGKEAPVQKPEQHATLDCLPPT